MSSRADRGLDDTLRLAAILLPAAVAATAVMQIGFAYLRSGRASRATEFLALSTTIVVLISAGVVIRRRRLRAAEAWPIAGWTIAMAAILQLMPQMPVHWDFTVYRRAADAMRAGITPYPDPSYYTYPPLLAQWLGGIAAAANRLFMRAPTDDVGWQVTFVVLQIWQLIAVSVVYWALYRSARSYGLSETVSALLVAGLLAVNEPLRLTIGDGQLNLILVAMVLAAIAMPSTLDALVGVGLALPGAIKLYPLTLLPVWWINGRRRAAAWAVAWLAVFVLITRPWTLWLEFVRLWMRPALYPTVSDSTLFNLLANGARFFGLAARDRPASWIRLVWIALVIAIAMWSIQRIVRRVRAADLESDASRLLFACASEVLVLNLFVSPLVWPHHFVFALPFAVFAAATEGPRRPILIGTALFLTFAVPWSDVFVLGYHRLAGVALALYATTPRPRPIEATSVAV
jgi:alpha-1,2-mannosyltransferase